MRLVSNGTMVSLLPVSYQFPNMTDESDANWVVIAGSVTSPEGSWSFRQPCLTTCEAKDVSAWFRSLAEGAVEPASPNDEGWITPGFSFTEPNLAVSVAKLTTEVVEIRVHLSYESAPPWLDRRESINIWKFFVVVPMQASALVAAAD